MFGLNLLRPVGARGFSSSAVVEKLKTHKGTAKRFTVTGTGIVSPQLCPLPSTPANKLTNSSVT